MQPQPTEKEIQFILDAIAEYLTVKVRDVFFMHSLQYVLSLLNSGSAMLQVLLGKAQCNTW